MAKERKFETPTALRKAIDGYFRSISRTETVKESVPTGKLDKYGHPVMKQVEVISDAGTPVSFRRFLIPPRLGRLYMELGISETTFRRYADGEVGKSEKQKAEFSRVCAWARAECEDWLRNEKLTRVKGLAGVMHELERNYDDGVTKKVSFEGAAPMTMDERTALLESLGILPGEGEDDEE